MLETYRERLSAIEDYYNTRDFVRTISECGTLVEHVISDTFRGFHTQLKTPADRKKFFDFEQKQWENYSKFIQRPTMGVSIRFYAPLSKGLFKNHPRMDGDVVKPLGQVNNWRNKVAHAGAEPPSENDADDVLEDTETIIKKMGIEDETHDDIGIPISTYLILSSILQKASTAESEGDFRQIIGDSRKLIPSLVNLCIEREYALLKLEHKQLVVDQYVADGTLEIELESGASILEKIEFFDRAEGDLERQLDRVLDDSGDTFTLRAIRPYTSLLTEFNQYLRSEGDDIVTILGFADQIKEKYLNENQIDDRERLELEIMGQHQGISKMAMERLEKVVVSAIEADIVLFQTFHPSGSEGEDNTAEIEAQLVQMISMGTPLAAITAMASSQGYSGNVEALFEQHASQAAEPEPEPEIDQATVKAELVSLATSDTPVEKDVEVPIVDTVVSGEGEMVWASKITPYRAITLEITEEDQNVYQASAETIAGWVEQVVQAEAPVHRQLVYSRICDGVGLGKAGSNVTTAIDKGIELALNQGRIRAVDEIRQDEEGNKRHYWFYYQTDTNLIPARNWEKAPDRGLLLVSDEEIESMARVLFGDPIRVEDTIVFIGPRGAPTPVVEDTTATIRQIWSGLGFGRVTQKMVAQTEPVMAKIASAADVKLAPDEVPTEQTYTTEGLFKLIEKNGGEMSLNEIYEAVEKSGELKMVDLELNNSNVIRYKHSIRGSLSDLKDKQKRLENPSRGIWRTSHQN